MQKIMFNDRYGLTEAVLSGRKTQTRRIVSDKIWDEWAAYDDYCSYAGVSGCGQVSREDERSFFLACSPYKVGKIVAVAQSYRDVSNGGYPVDSRYDAFRAANWGDGEDGELKSSAGWANKLFVRADLMPHQIRITNVRVERLQDISDEDSLSEGIRISDVDPMNPLCYLYDYQNSRKGFYSPKDAYADLINCISGKGTWDSNPYVFVYEFELTK